MGMVMVMERGGGSDVKAVDEKRNMVFTYDTTCDHLGRWTRTLY
jgi:hypothetical protein